MVEGDGGWASISALREVHPLWTDHIHQNQGLLSICDWYHRLRKIRLRLVDVFMSWLVAWSLHLVGLWLVLLHQVWYINRYLPFPHQTVTIFQWFAFYLRRSPIASSFLPLQAHLWFSVGNLPGLVPHSILPQMGNMGVGSWFCLSFFSYFSVPTQTIITGGQMKAVYFGWTTYTHCAQM